MKKPMKKTEGYYMPGKFFASFLSAVIFLTSAIPAVAQEDSSSGMSRSMDQAIRLYRAGESTEAMDRFMDILVKGSPSEKALANEYISKITMGMNTGVTGINDDDTDAGLAAVRQQNQTRKNAAHGIKSTSGADYAPERVSEVNSAARKDVIAKRVYKATEEMRRDVLLKLSNLSSVKLYTKNGRLTALSMNSNFFFAGDTAFKSGTEEALGLISGLIFALGKVSCLILPEGSVGGDIKIKNIRRAIALNSYLENRGVAKAKIDVDLVGNDVSIPKELSNVGGLIILFDYSREPRLKPVDDMKTKGPRVSLGVYPTAIAPHKNEGAIVEFSVMELPSGIPSWSFQVYQSQPDGSRLQLQEIHGTGAQYNQSYWNGRRNFFGIPYPAGRYIFSLTAKDVEGNETTISRYIQIQPSPQEGQRAKVSNVRTLKQKATPGNEFESMNIDLDDSPAAKKKTAKKTSKKKSSKKKVTNKKSNAAKDSSSQDSSKDSFKVYFRENTANITSSGEKKISEIADVLTVDTSSTVRITGYASSSEPDPQSLAESRSNYVADKFVEEYSIDASRITTTSSVSDTPQCFANVEINNSK
ncbi:MAG: OmpA family protein [Elusimicrobiales bacterium]|nr:OmpA family protein [Elusimicrobiales bacterium]